MPVHGRGSFENLCAGQPRWEIGRPQKAFMDVADQITGPILDSGCGTGEIALLFASRGHKVTEIDFLADPITIAKRKATERGQTVTFLVMDALTLKELPEVFDNVFDSGLFHVFSDGDRRRYVDGLASVAVRAVASSFSVSATRSRGHRGHGGSVARRSRTPSPKAGRSSPSSRHGTRFVPIRMTSASATAGRRRGSWW